MKTNSNGIKDLKVGNFVKSENAFMAAEAQLKLFKKFWYLN
jgi:hypothetical protein